MIEYINEEAVKKVVEKVSTDDVGVDCGPGDCNPVNNW